MKTLDIREEDQRAAGYRDGEEARKGGTGGGGGGKKGAGIRAQNIALQVTREKYKEQLVEAIGQ